MPLYAPNLALQGQIQPSGIHTSVAANRPSWPSQVFSRYLAIIRDNKRHFPVTQEISVWATFIHGCIYPICGCRYPIRVIYLMESNFITVVATREGGFSGSYNTFSPIAGCIYHTEGSARLYMTLNGVHSVLDLYVSKIEQKKTKKDQVIHSSV